MAHLPLPPPPRSMCGLLKDIFGLWILHEVASVKVMPGISHLAGVPPSKQNTWALETVMQHNPLANRVDQMRQIIQKWLEQVDNGLKSLICAKDLQGRLWQEEAAEGEHRKVFLGALEDPEGALGLKFFC